ncbi:MAG: PAS domain S-box protein [bacterium]
MDQVELKNWLHTELMEKVPTNIAIIDRQFKIVEANQRFENAYGEWRDKHCFEVYKRRSSPCLNCVAYQTFQDGQPRVNEEEGVDKNGKPSYYVVHVEPVQGEGGVIPYVIEMSNDVTQQRMMQQEHDIIFDRVPCYISVLDRDMTVVRNNELFRKRFGEALGKKCYQIYQHADEPCRDCPAMQTFSDGDVHTAYKTGKDKTGRTVYYYVNTAPLSRGGAEPSHVIEMALDMTETKVLEQQLKQAFDFQENLINSAIDAIVAVDSEGKINIFNPQAEKLFQRSAREVMGKNILDQFVPKQFIDIIAKDGESLLLRETYLTDANGEQVPVRFSGTVLKSGGHYLGSSAVLQDLRQRKQLEHEKLEAERMAAVGQTVAGLAHGIKNVLTGLEGGMYVVNSGMKKNDMELTQKGWNMLQNNIERITTYVKDFLGFARGREPNVERTDPNKVAREVEELFRDKTEQLGIRFTSDFQPGIGEANLDADGIHNCLVNLVSNAVDACEMSDKKDCEIRLKTFEENGTLYFEVADNGTGMDYEVKKKVFTTFFSTKGTSKGTGLGLLVTKRIAQEHGGKVELDSQEGKGSTFRLVFPRQRLPELTDKGNEEKKNPEH